MKALTSFVSFLVLFGLFTLSGAQASTEKLSTQEMNQIRAQGAIKMLNLLEQQLGASAKPAWTSHVRKEYQAFKKQLKQKNVAMGTSEYDFAKANYLLGFAESHPDPNAQRFLMNMALYETKDRALLHQLPKVIEQAIEYGLKTDPNVRAMMQDPKEGPKLMRMLQMVLPLLPDAYQGAIVEDLVSVMKRPGFLTKREARWLPNQQIKKIIPHITDSEISVKRQMAKDLHPLQKDTMKLLAKVDESVPAKAQQSAAYDDYMEKYLKILVRHGQADLANYKQSLLGNQILPSQVLVDALDLGLDITQHVANNQPLPVSTFEAAKALTQRLNLPSDIRSVMIEKVDELIRPFRQIEADMPSSSLTKQTPSGSRTLVRAQPVKVARLHKH